MHFCLCTRWHEGSADGTGRVKGFESTQGFHWFANEAALREIHRVLRSDTGALVLFWNREDNGVPWAADLLGVFEPLGRGIPQVLGRDRLWDRALAS